MTLAGMVVALASCSTSGAQISPQSVTFVVVRHAEKALDDAEDPSLNEAGRSRAERLAQVMARTPPAAIYATQFRRTQQTAQPSGIAFGLPVLRYQAQQPAADLARQLRETHDKGVVLVVGHSNTVPDIVTALSGETVPQMPESEYGVLYRVHIGPGDHVVLERSSF